MHVAASSEFLNIKVLVVLCCWRVASRSLAGSSSWQACFHLSIYQFLSLFLSPSKYFLAVFFFCRVISVNIIVVISFWSSSFVSVSLPLSTCEECFHLSVYLFSCLFVLSLKHFLAIYFVVRVINVDIIFISFFCCCCLCQYLPSSLSLRVFIFVSLSLRCLITVVSVNIPIAPFFVLSVPSSVSLIFPVDAFTFLFSSLYIHFRSYLFPCFITASIPSSQVATSTFPSPVFFDAGVL